MDNLKIRVKVGGKKKTCIQISPYSKLSTFFLKISREDCLTLSSLYIEYDILLPFFEV